MNNITYFNDTVDKTEYDKILSEYNTVKESYTNSLATIRTLNNRIHNMKQEIKEFVVNGLSANYVSQDDLKELAEMFEIPLTQDVTFTATVSFSVSATVPLGFDMDEIENLDFTASLDYNGSELDNIDFDYAEVVIEDVEV